MDFIPTVEKLYKDSTVTESVDLKFVTQRRAEFKNLDDMSNMDILNEAELSRMLNKRYLNNKNEFFLSHEDF